jgi:hypothetical protein
MITGLQVKIQTQELSIMTQQSFIQFFWNRGIIIAIIIIIVVGLRIPARYIRDFALFNVCFQVKIVPLLDAH